MRDIARLSAKTAESKNEKLISKALYQGIYRSVDSPVDHILYLQKTVGNQAVRILLTSGDIQPKLRIGEPNDKYEREADRVADLVMRMPEPLAQPQHEEEEEDLIQTKPLPLHITPLVRRQAEEEEEEELLQTKEQSNQSPELASDLEARINALKGGGQPLPESMRAFFEPRFGYDCSGVRIHTDAEAHSLNEALNSRAFTTGKDVFFRPGAYYPGSSSGR